MGQGTKKFGKVSLLTLVIGALLLAAFRWLYPDMRVDAAPLTLILLLAIITSSLLELAWRKLRSKGEGHDQ